MFSCLPAYFLPIILSALALGVYDICRKHAVKENSVLPVLFFSCLSGFIFYTGMSFFKGNLGGVFSPPLFSHYIYVLLKSIIVGASWVLGFYAMRELPITLAAPIRASAPLWTFLGSLLLYGEVPTPVQGLAMLIIFAGYYAFSILGKMEGFTLRHKGILLIIGATLLGAGAALFDKYLLNILKIDRNFLQFHFAMDLVFLTGICLAARQLFSKGIPFQWRWSIPATGILLIIADALYFYAVSLPEIHISILSLVRRSSCVVAFLAGATLFRDTNVKKKLLALLAILLGLALLALF